MLLELFDVTVTVKVLSPNEQKTLGDCSTLSQIEEKLGKVGRISFYVLIIE